MSRLFVVVLSLFYAGIGFGDDPTRVSTQRPVKEQADEQRLDAGKTGSQTTAGSAGSTIGAAQPNVIFIFCDDLGWGDFGVLHQNHSGHSKRHRTPNIDRMAAEGVVMRAHYCGAPVCAPSRATLLSGVHQGHAEVRDNQFDKALANNHTLGSVLRDAGYKTWMVGKHGLQGKGDNPDQWSGYPTKRGFDRFYGYVRHADGHVHYPADRWELGNSESHRSPKQVWDGEKEVSEGLSKCYTTDLFTARGKQWMIEHERSGAKEPFFLYLAFDTPHAALQVPTGPYPEGNGVDGGLQWVGEPGRMINTVRGEIDSYRHPDYAARGWQDVEVRFATMVRRIDDCVGDLMQTLVDLGIDQETIVVISSDNGPLNVSYLAGQPIEASSFQSYGPFDGIKRDVWEGGIRMATVAWGPGVLASGIVDEHPSQSQDWMATFADFAGVLPPARCDGVSLRSALTGKAEEQVASRIYVEYFNGGKTPRYQDFEPRKRGLKRGQMQVVHVDRYKGIRVNIKNGWEPFQIYDLREDPDESSDLSGSSVFFEDLQERMHQKALRGRRPNADSPRPYDSIPIPSVTLSKKQLESKELGVQWRWIDGKYSYTPDLRLATVDDRGADSWTRFRDLDWWDNDGAVELVSWYFAAETTEYQFRITGMKRGFLRVHDASLLDLDSSDANQTAEVATVRLERGWHPLRLTARVGDLNRDFSIECRGSADSAYVRLNEGELFSISQ